MRYDPFRIAKLKMLVMELDSLPVWFCLCVLARLQAEEEGDLDEVGQALVEGAGDVGQFLHNHDEAQRGGFFPLRRRILIQEVVENPR